MSDVTYYCPNCETELLYAGSGIGYYCPNDECDALEAAKKAIQKMKLQPHWKYSVHSLDKWELVARVSLPDDELDIYIHKNKEQYEGVSIQYGPDEPQYYSSSHPYVDDGVTSLSDGLLKAFAIEHDRHCYRNKQ